MIYYLEGTASNRRDEEVLLVSMLLEETVGHQWGLTLTELPTSKDTSVIIGEDDSRPDRAQLAALAWAYATLALRFGCRPEEVVLTAPEGWKRV